MSQLDIFEDNSSTRDSLADFAEGKLNSYELERDCWPKDCKELIRKLRRNGVARFRMMSRRWCTKQGYDWRN